MNKKVMTMGLKKYITADEREALYNEVWTDPVVKVAKRYGISDNGLRKRCRKFGIPLPSSGYWSKVRAGKKVKKTPLPPVTGDIREVVRNYAIKYKSNIHELPDEILLDDEELHLLSEDTKILIKEVCFNVKVKSQLRNADQLIIEHMQEIKYRKKRDKELKNASLNIRYYNHLRTDYRKNKEVLPINVSHSNIKRIYRIVDTIIKTMNELEGSIHISRYSEKDNAYFSLMYATFELDIREKVNKKQKAIYLSLQPKSKSYYYGAILSYNKKMIYKDTPDEPLENQVGKIINDIFIAANRITAINEYNRREEEKRWLEEEKKREEEKRKQLLEKVRNNELEDLNLLTQASSDWENAQRIRKFIDMIEYKLCENEYNHEKEKILKWLKWARDKADWLDPLIEKNDDLLGESKTIFDKIINESIDQD